MVDRIFRVCLLGSLVLIGMLLLRPVATSPTQFQPIQQNQPVMVVDNATLYVLSNNKISVYYWDGPATAKLKPRIGTLKLLQTLDTKQIP